MGILGKKVPLSTYDTAIRERNAFEKEVERLQEQVADLSSKYSALGFDEALVRSLAQKALGLLERVSTTHRASPNFKREIDVLVGEARSAGLVEEKQKEE